MARKCLFILIGAALLSAAIVFAEVRAVTVEDETTDETLEEVRTEQYNKQSIDVLSCVPLQATPPPASENARARWQQPRCSLFFLSSSSSSSSFPFRF